MTAKRECDMSITSMITDIIGKHEVLLSINQNYDKIWEKKLDQTRLQLYVFVKQQQLTQGNVRQQHAHMMHSVHFHRYDM